jgi:death-on-curing family protein
MIISVGYRVKSKIATKFRKWATQTLRDYIVKGYAINDQRLKEKSKQLETLKNAISLIERGISNQIENIEEARHLNSFLNEFARGFELLDDYDHERLDKSGKTKSKTEIIEVEEFLNIINVMKNKTESNVFGLPKDESFESSINQIYQSFGNMECYQTVEEKAAMLLYLIVKNHSFIDGNKRIAAACFLYFLEKHEILKSCKIDSNTLFAITILVADSNPSEMDPIKNIIVTILNRRDL